MPCNQIFPNDYDSYAGRTYILLSSRVNDSISGKIDRSRTQIGCHIADDWHGLRYFLKWEVHDLEAICRLIVNKVEKVCIRIHIPILLSHRDIIYSLSILDDTNFVEEEVLNKKVDVL